MSRSEVIVLFIGLGLGLVLAPVFSALLRAVTVRVNENEAVSSRRAPKRMRTLETPGRLASSKLLPGVGGRRIPRRMDFLHVENLPIEDTCGGRFAVDLWLEFRLVDASKATAAGRTTSLGDLVLRTVRAVVAQDERVALQEDRRTFGRHIELRLRREGARQGFAIGRVLVCGVVASSGPESTDASRDPEDAPPRCLH